jgi:hypothetical protein
VSRQVCELMTTDDIKGVVAKIIVSVACG